MKKRFVFATALIPVFTIYCLLFTISYAQNKDQFSLGIFPTIIEINADPPAIIKSNISIENQSENELQLNLIVRFFKPKENGDGQIELLPEGQIYGSDPTLLQKVKILEDEAEIKDITLKPFEAKNLTLEINLDRGSPVSDYYFSVIFISKTNDSQETSGSQILGGIGTNVILSVGKKGETIGEIREFSAPAVVFSGPIPFTLYLRNNSQHYIVPEGNIIIKDMFGRKAGQLNILPQYILSNSDRFMYASDQTSPSILPHTTLIWPEKFLLGLYTATAQVRLAQEGPVFETKTTFLALPLYIIAAISFFAFVLIGIWIKVKKKI